MTVGPGQPEPLGPGKLIGEPTSHGAATPRDSHLDAWRSPDRGPAGVAGGNRAAGELHHPGCRVIDLDPGASGSIRQLALRGPGTTSGTNACRLAHDPTRQVEGVDAVLDDSPTTSPRPIHLPM